MNSRLFIDWVRELVSHLRKGGGLNEDIIAELESRQDQLAERYDIYESSESQESTQVLRELMMEALQLLHNGLEDLLEYADEPSETLLDSGLAAIEEGNDVLESLRYALEQDTSWTSSAAVS